MQHHPQITDGLVSFSIFPFMSLTLKYAASLNQLQLLKKPTNHHI